MKNTIHNTKKVFEDSKKQIRSINSKLNPLNAPFQAPYSYGNVTLESYSPRFDKDMAKRSKELRESEKAKKNDLRGR